MPVFGWSAKKYEWPPALAAVAIAAALLGGILPLVAHFGIKPDDKAGANLSYVYLSNIVGSAAGSLITGFVFLDHWSLQQIGAIIACIGMVLVAALVLLAEMPLRGRLVSLVSLGAVSILLVKTTPVVYDRIWERLLYKWKFDEKTTRFRDVVETKSGIITVTQDSILGYMPSIPHWGYNGSARRFWDFFYGAAPGGTAERQLHHYGSGLNAIAVLSAFRSSPDDFYLLRTGYAGAMGGLSNVDQDGFAGTAFHSFPENMRWDTYSGDYGPNFFGVAVNAGTYVVNRPEFGWQAFGGNAKTDSDWVRIQPLDAFRQRIYVGPLGLFLTLDSGTFESIEINTRTRMVRLGLAAATAAAPRARLRIEHPAKIPGLGEFRPRQRLSSEREAFAITLQSKTTWVELVPAK